MAKTQRYVILVRGNRKNGRRHRVTYEPIHWKVAEKDNQFGAFPLENLKKWYTLNVYTKTQAEKIITENKAFNKGKYGHQSLEYRLLPINPVK